MISGSGWIRICVRRLATTYFYMEITSVELGGIGKNASLLGA
jgi:hypothetical protein